MLHRYVVDFPFEDDFVQVLAAPGYFEFYPTWREKIADLFSLSVEHRIVTMRLAAIVQTWLPGWARFPRPHLFRQPVMRGYRPARDLARAIRASRMARRAGRRSFFFHQPISPPNTG